VSAPDRERRDELASLHALGVLSDVEQAELAALASTDPTFAADVRALEGAVAALGGAVPQIDPPAALRARVLASITGAVPESRADSRRAGSEAPAPAPTVTPFRRAEPRRGAQTFAWLAAAASLVAAAGMGLWTWQLQDRVRELDERLVAAQDEVVTLTRTLGSAQEETKFLKAQATVLVAPDLLRVDLAGQPNAPGASGRAYWSRRSGMVFATTALPALPANKSYQVWVIADQQAPISAGLVSLSDLGQDGRALRFFSTPADLPTPKIVAVTIEPEGGVPQPTGEKVLVGLTGL
jgi:anti-sigma-K factor RskA